jgi:hypothetical protein
VRARVQEVEVRHARVLEQELVQEQAQQLMPERLLYGRRGLLEQD